PPGPHARAQEGRWGSRSSCHSYAPVLVRIVRAGGGRARRRPFHPFSVCSRRGRRRSFAVPLRGVAQPGSASRTAGRLGRHHTLWVHTFGVWRSPVARLVRDEDVVGSNPATPTPRTPFIFMVEGVSSLV